MLVTCIALLAPSAQAEEPKQQEFQEVQLQDKKAEIDVPDNYEVTLDFKDQSQRDVATWSNTRDNNHLEISCGEQQTPTQQPGTEPGTEGYGEREGAKDMDKVMLKIEDQKHELAQLQNFRFTCPEGEYVNVTDQQGKNIASMESPLVLTVTKVREQRQPDITGSL